VRLDEQDRRAVFLAEGLGHGFMALSEQATVLYLCSTPYSPGREHGIHPLDPTLGIAWPLDGPGDTPILSEKDAAALPLEEALLSGALPSYGDCTANTARRQRSRPKS
jgi:dTDP-4-dehydrorhamnose 3,5-epimerase